MGITRTSLQKRWKWGTAYKGSPHFYSSIKKYGWNGFTHYILADGLAKEEALQMEQEYIARYKTQDRRYGYNATSGGEHFTHSEESKKKDSESLKRYYAEHPEERAKLGLRNIGRKGSYKQKCACKKTMDTLWADPEFRKKMHDRFVGANNPNFGGVSDVTRKKMRENSAKARPCMCIESGIEYPSCTVAGEETSSNPCLIYQVCIGNRKTHNKLHWKFI